MLLAGVKLVRMPHHPGSSLRFPNTRRVGPSNFYHREFRVLLQKSELEGWGFTFHSLRHTFATELFRRRMHPKVVQSLLEHSSITQTMDRYLHLLEGIGGRRRGRPRRIFRLAGLQYGCSTRGPAEYPSLTFYPQKGG